MTIKLTDRWGNCKDNFFEEEFTDFVTRANWGEGGGLVEQTQEEVKNALKVISLIIEHLVEKQLMTLETALKIVQPYSRYELAKTDV